MILLRLVGASAQAFWRWWRRSRFVVQVALVTVGGLLLLRGGWGLVVRSRGPSVPGLEAPRRHVTVAEVGLDAIDARLAAAQQAALNGDARCRRTALARLGLVTTVEPTLAYDVDGALQRYLPSARTRAFYAPGSDTIFVTDRTLLAVRHEWVHAVDDQHSGRMRRGLSASSTDESVALRAAIEGSAVVLSGGAPVALPSPSSLDDLAWYLAYGVGPLYVAHHVRGLAPRVAADTALALAPGTVWELTHGTPRPPVAIAQRVPVGGRVLCTDRAGAAAVWVATTRLGLPAADAERFAGAWRWDRLDLVDEATGPAVVWQVLFDDPHVAEEWQAKVAVPLMLLDSRQQVRALADSVSGATTGR